MLLSMLASVSTLTASFACMHLDSGHLYNPTFALASADYHLSLLPSVRIERICHVFVGHVEGPEYHRTLSA
jgi:hypothetical protein